MKRLRTRWADRVDENHVLEEYPRPRMERDSYVNLNGRWDYAITREGTKPEVYDGMILVPFSPEADLSGEEQGAWKGRILQAVKCSSFGKERAAFRNSEDNRGDRNADW